MIHVYAVEMQYYNVCGFIAVLYITTTVMKGPYIAFYTEFLSF
jgi:hypothetical protein